jgi:hypothetical protein
MPTPRIWLLGDRELRRAMEHAVDAHHVLLVLGGVEDPRPGRIGGRAPAGNDAQAAPLPPPLRSNGVPGNHHRPIGQVLFDPQVALQGPVGDDGIGGEVGLQRGRVVQQQGAAFPHWFDVGADPLACFAGAFARGQDHHQLAREAGIDAGRRSLGGFGGARPTAGRGDDQDQAQEGQQRFQHVFGSFFHD